MPEDGEMGSPKPPPTLALEWRLLSVITLRALTTSPWQQRHGDEIVRNMTSVGYTRDKYTTSHGSCITKVEPVSNWNCGGRTPTCLRIFYGIYCRLLIIYFFRNVVGYPAQCARDLGLCKITNFSLFWSFFLKKIELCFDSAISAVSTELWPKYWA